MSIAEQAQPANGALVEAKPAPPRREIRVVEDHGPLAHLMDTAKFEHAQRIAALMAEASLLPDHLRGKGGDIRQTIANCFLVVNQAFRWKMDPFAVAPETYSVGNKLAYQGKLVAALVNTRAGLSSNLRYEFSGQGENRTVRAIGWFEGEDQPRDVSVVWKDAATKNEMWKKDPDQKLIYNAAIKWARRHCPEVLLGVLTDDDLERISEAPERAQEATYGKSVLTLDALADRLNGGTGEVEEAAPHVEQAEKTEGAPDPFAWCKTAADVESVYAELREAQGGDPMEPGTDELETARVVAMQRVGKK